jgi:hypothetical protein
MKALRRGSAVGGKAGISVKCLREALGILAADGSLSADQDVVNKGALQSSEARRLKRASVKAPSIAP